MKDFIKSKECFASFAVALIPSLGFWILKPTDSVPYAFFVIAVMLALLFLWLFLMSYFSKTEIKEPYSVRIIEIRDTIYLCHPNKLLSQDVFVSFYLQTNKFEKLIGYGVVTNVQMNGIIQISPLESTNGYSIDDLFAQNVSDIIIKPTVTINYLSQKINEKESTRNERNPNSIYN